MDGGVKSVCWYGNLHANPDDELIRYNRHVNRFLLGYGSDCVNSIWHFGHLSPLFPFTSGCIGQEYNFVSPDSDVTGGGAEIVSVVSTLGSAVTVSELSFFLLHAMASATTNNSEMKVFI
jgi:hypothetical protein